LILPHTTKFPQFVTRCYALQFRMDVRVGCLHALPPHPGLIYTVVVLHRIHYNYGPHTHTRFTIAHVYTHYHAVTRWTTVTICGYWTRYTTPHTVVPRYGSLRVYPLPVYLVAAGLRARGGHGLVLPG